MGELHDLSAAEQRDAIRRGELSSRELVEHYLERIAARNDELAAFITVTADEARAAAAAADERQAAGGPLGTLHGMPLAFKDLTDTAGVRTTYGSAAFEHHVPTRNAPMVRAMNDAGAVSVGKTNVPEFGLTGYTENLIAPPARLPADTRLSPAGSSGGSAVAVAAGLIPFGPGTDGGGSIRIPAAATGLIGLKPNRGRVPSGSAQEDLAGVAVAGPLARTAEDAGLLLDALVTGPPPRAVTAAPAGLSFREAARRAPARLRIGVSTASPFDGWCDTSLSTEARNSMDAAVRTLVAAGHTVDNVDIDYGTDYPDAFTAVWTSGVATLGLPDGGQERLTPLTQMFRRRAAAASGPDLTRAVGALRRFEARVIKQYSACDVILTPALTRLPPPIGWYWEGDADLDYRRQCEYSPYTSMLNVVGLPAITVPTWWAPSGLSMSAQLIGRPSDEATLLSLAGELARGITPAGRG
ncbi:amidase [Spelaeicoccus albus]|uniref:Amidase n=1 Tax=Spelaeicoccus albus TaxID=1280376 RepID=A0A7Z0IHP1_9MICO|nr:amidase [Spelaeicoccus albus]NYI67850.1 amidase [Spelaeicoccus albus]